MHKNHVFHGLAIFVTLTVLLSLASPTLTMAQISPNQWAGPDHFFRTVPGMPFESDDLANMLLTTPPVAVADIYTVEADTTLNVAAPGVLANDYDADGDSLTAELVGGASHGVLTFNTNGSFVYTPTAGYIGSDYFTYKAYDGLDYSSPVMVTIDVISEGDAVPVAVADSYQTDSNTTLTVDAAHGVLANDLDADGEPEPLTAQPLGGASHGTLTLYADGSFVYVPDVDYAGSDYFTYQASDGLYLSSPAMVTINVTSEDDTAPVAVADHYATDTGITLTVSAADGVLSNDYDMDGLPQPLTAKPLGGASHGTLILYADGSFVYTPEPGYIGSDYFTYQAFDGLYLSKPTMVTIDVVGINAEPIAVADTYAVEVNTTLTVDATGGVLANDVDPDGGPLPLIAQQLGGASHGTLILLEDGSFTYVPTVDYVGADYFTYQAYDGLDVSNPVMVTIDVKGDNTAPQAVADAYTVESGSILSVAAPGVLDNDYDADGDSLTAQQLGGASHGSLTLHIDGSFVYTPEAGYVGSDYFTYQAYDWIDVSKPVMVTIQVTAESNVAPVAVADSYTAYSGSTLTVPAPGVLANDYDADGDALTAQELGGASHGTLTLYANGSFIYVPDSGYIGSDYFTYQVSDGQELSNPVMVTINVTFSPFSGHITFTPIVIK